MFHNRFSDMETNDKLSDFVKEQFEHLTLDEIEEVVVENSKLNPEAREFVPAKISSCYGKYS